jgi:hypothetical protein
MSIIFSCFNTCPLADIGPWFCTEIYKMYLWIKFVCLSVSGAAFIPFSQKKQYLHCFHVLRADICPLQDDNWLNPYPLTLQQQFAVQGRAGPRSANWAFCLRIGNNVFVLCLKMLANTVSLVNQHKIKASAHFWKCTKKLRIVTHDPQYFTQIFNSCIIANSCPLSRLCKLPHSWTFFCPWPSWTKMSLALF